MTTMKISKAIAIVFLLAIGTLTVGCSYSPAAAAEWEARKAVEKRLKSPDSAKYEVSEVAAHSEGEGLFIVYLAVDSQNAFGAVVRTHALVLVLAGKEMGDNSEALHLEVTKGSPAIGRIKELMREAGGAWELEDWVKG